MTRTTILAASALAVFAFMSAPVAAQELGNDGGNGGDNDGGAQQFQSPPSAEFGDDAPGGLSQSPPVTGGDPTLGAAEFDALTRGKTFDTYDSESGLYGVESFLSGQRVIWRDADRCMHGSWDQVGDNICFLYEDKPNDPVCWTYHDRAGWILGRYQGLYELPPIMLYPAQGPISCQSYLGA